MKLRKGDLVLIVAGKDKGKTGKVEKVLPKEQRVVVEGINLYKRHVKARTQGQKSEIVTITKPLSIANVAYFDGKTKKPTRIGYKIEKDTKTRISKTTGKEL